MTSSRKVSGSNESHKERTAFGEYDADAWAVAIQADGKIVAAGGVAEPESSVSQFALARYNVDGTLDTTFGEGGQVMTAFGEYGADARAVAIQADGKIVAAGSSYPTMALARYNVAGSLDATFGEDGRVTAWRLFAAQARAVAIQADGKILVAGQEWNCWPGGVCYYGSLLVRLNVDGTMDATFGVDGLVANYVRTKGTNGVAIAADGKIIAVGDSGGRVQKFSVTRYNPDGTLDLDFSTDGAVRTRFSTGAGARAVAIQSDGAIVAVGWARLKFALARYLA